MAKNPRADGKIYVMMYQMYHQMMHDVPGVLYVPQLTINLTKLQELVNFYLELGKLCIAQFFLWGKMDKYA